MRVELVNTRNPQESFVFHNFPAIIGQGSAADVRLHDFWLGGYHCMIDREGETLMVLDLGCTNGTFVNEVRTRRARLMPGDTLTLGRTHLLVQYEPHRQEACSAVPIRNEVSAGKTAYDSPISVG